MIRDALERSLRFVTEHNRITLVLMLVLTAVVVAGIPMLPTGSQAGGTAAEFQHLETVQKSDYIQETYAPDIANRTNVTYETIYVHRDSGEALTKKSLLAELRFQQEIRANDSVAAAMHDEGVLGLASLVASRAAAGGQAGSSAESPDLDEQIAALEAADEATVEAQVEQTLADPRAQRFMPASFSGTTSPSSMTSPSSTSDRRFLVALDRTAPSDAVQRAKKAIFDAAETRSDAGFFTLGQYARQDFSSHFFGEMIELVLPLALLLILAVLAFSYRDIVDVVVGMTGVVLSVLWMFGLLGWLRVNAGIVSIIPVVLITGLSIDFGFHVFNRYREERREDEGIREPMHRGLLLVATALVLVTVTSGIGFLANLSNPLPMIRTLGISITLGVVAAFVIFLTVVPALKISIDGLLERGGLDRRKASLGRGRYLEPLLESSVALARRAAPVVLAVALLLGGLGGLAWTGLAEESFQQGNGEVAEWKQQLPEPLGWSQHPYQEHRSIARDQFQPASAEEAMRSRILIEGSVTDDDTLAGIAAGVAQIDDAGLLLDQPGESAVRSPLSVMQQVAGRNEAFAAEFEAADSDGDGVPDRNVEALYDALYEANPGLASRVIERTDGEYRSVLVSLSLDAGFGDAEASVGILTEAATAMDGEDRTATVAGQMAVREAILDDLVSGILRTMVIAMLAIVVTLSAVFRLLHGSATLGAVVSVPIALVIGLVIGGMYLLAIPLTLLTALLMSLVVGIGIDYNIHVGDRFADEIRAGKPTYEALSAAVTGTGGALLGSTLTTAGAFATIALVPDPQLESFGLIVVVALVTAFVVSVGVLPSMLALWARVTDRSAVPSEEGTPGAVTAQD